MQGRACLQDADPVCHLRCVVVDVYGTRVVLQAECSRTPDAKQVERQATGDRQSRPVGKPTLFAFRQLSPQDGAHMSGSRTSTASASRGKGSLLGVKCRTPTWKLMRCCSCCRWAAAAAAAASASDTSAEAVARRTCCRFCCRALQAGSGGGSECGQPAGTCALSEQGYPHSTSMPLASLGSPLPLLTARALPWPPGTLSAPPPQTSPPS